MDNDLTFDIESLEQRKMMAADVSLVGGRLNIVGDNEAEIVRLQGTGVAGQVEVVNNLDVVGVFDDVQSIRVNLRGGDDDLFVSAIDIPGNLIVRLGSGKDQFDMDTDVKNVYGSIASNGVVNIGGDVRANLGGDEGDEIDWDTFSDGNGMTIGDDVAFWGANDVNLSAFDGSSGIGSGDINIGDRLNIYMPQLDNHLDLNDVNVFGKAFIRGGKLEDDFELEDARFESLLTVRLGASDDILETDDSLFLNGVNFDGGSGFDQLDEVEDSEFPGGSKLNAFEEFDN